MILVPATKIGTNELNIRYASNPDFNNLSLICERIEPPTAKRAIISEIIGTTLPPMPHAGILTMVWRCQMPQSMIPRNIKTPVNRTSFILDFAPFR